MEIMFLWHLITCLVSPDIRKILTSRTAKSVLQINSKNICGTYWRLSDLLGSSVKDREKKYFIIRI